MDIRDFEWKDPELFNEIYIQYSNGARDSELFNFMRKRKLEKIENLIWKLNQQKFSPSLIHEHSQSKQNENAVLSWFEGLKKRVPKEEYFKAVDIYKTESRKLWEEEEGGDVVPYPIELIPSLKKRVPEAKTRGRKPANINRKRDEIIRRFLSQGVNNQDICKELDKRRFPIPITWKNDLRQKKPSYKGKLKWCDAYFDNELRNNIHKLFYKVKSKPLS